MDDGWCSDGTIHISVAPVPAASKEALRFGSGRPRVAGLAAFDDERLGREGGFADKNQLIVDKLQAFGDGVAGVGDIFQGRVDRADVLAQFVHRSCPVLTKACSRLVTGDGSSFR